MDGWMYIGEEEEEVKNEGLFWFVPILVKRHLNVKKYVA